MRDHKKHNREATLSVLIIEGRIKVKALFRLVPEPRGWIQSIIFWQISEFTKYFRL
jgi:hypothetical protein